MCTEFIQALLLLLFTCYHPFCQEHPKGFMLWPFAYCSFSHEWWSINKHQGVWKCARRGKRISTHTKKFQFFGFEIYTPTDNICFMSKFNSSNYIYFYSYFSLSLSLSLLKRLLFFWFTTNWCDYAHSISSCIIAYHKASNIVVILLR